MLCISPLKENMIRASSSSQFVLMAIWLMCAGFAYSVYAQDHIYIEKNEEAHVLRWNSEEGTTSFLQRSTDLIRWDYMLHYDVGDGSERTQEPDQEAGAEGQGLSFYRLQLYPTNLDDPDDTDGDGLPNSYELGHSGTNPTLSDTDNDGYGDFEELYALNSDPNDWTPAFTFVDDTLDSDGDGLANYLERMIGTDPLTPGDVWEEPEPQDIDSDGDGLKDSEETTTDPSLYDTDGDGYGDGWELSYNMDPLDPMDVYDALDFWTLPEAYRLATGLDDWGDEDGDYLSNAEEFWEGTDPLLWDTDGDGVSDGEEVYLNGTDPTDGLPYYRDEDGDGLSAWEEGLLGTSDLLLDSDNDGISDFEEIKVQNVYLAQFGLPGFDPTDPLDGQADWDHDGVTNADEIAAETDYLNMDGDGDGIANFAELKLGTDPLAANDFGNSDLDGDGLSTLAERDLATNDLSIDSDGDGLSDYLEGSNESPFASYLNPLDGNDALADLDGDGLSTIYEISIMLNSGGAGSSGEADQFDPVDYHPDNLVQYNYDPHTPGDGNFDPSNEDSNGNGIPDGEDDVDGDGLSASQEYNYRTDPLKKDTDGDDVLDNEDGWARCIDLAPKRIGKRTYAIIKVKEFPETTTYVGGEINNSGHWLIKTHSNIQYAGRSTSPHFYYDGETVTALPEFSGDDRPYRYEKLNEEGYFLRASWHIGKLTQDYSSPGALYRGIELKGEMPFSSSVFTAGFSFYELRGYEYFSSVTNAGTVYSHAYRETSPKPAGIPAPGAEYAGFYRILNMLGTPKAIEPQIAGVAAGDGDGKSGFTYTSESPLQTVRKGDPNDNDPPYVGTPTWVTGGSISNIYTTNAQDLSLAFRTKLDKFWRDSSANTQHGTVTHSLETWDGEKFSTLGLAVDNDQWRDYWPGPSFTQHYVNYSLAAHLNNKNTIILDSGIWLDTKAGLRNDQSVDKTPTYKKITWDPKWGDQPPRNLNTQMQGYASGSSRIWQNGYWLDLEADKLLGNSDYTDIKIRDINDHGMLAAQATNAEGKKCAVFLLPVEIVPDYNRDGMISDADVGQANEETPFVFWVNDDNDDNEIHEYADVPGAGTDGEDMRINGERDLVDFFPVQLRLAQILQILPADQYSYVISHPTGALNFLEMPTVEPESQREFYGAGSYLANEDMAYEAMGRSDQGEMKSTAGEGSELSGEYLEAAKNGKGVLLIEAKEETEQSFELVICRKSDKSEMARIMSEKWMNMVSVEDMFSYVNIRGAIEKGYIPPAIEEIQHERFRKTRKDRWFVFCHGYNVNGESARSWNAEVFKRLHQTGSDAKFLGVTWEGNQGQISEIILLAGGKTPDYWKNVHNAFKSSSALSEVVNGLTGGEKVIAGHSLGNMLVSSAICDHDLDAAQYFMVNAAVAREAYSASHAEADREKVRNEEWKNYPTRLWPSDYWNLGFAQGDGRRKLTWRGRFATLAAKTLPHNYYSSGEDVLQSGDGASPNLFNVVFKGEGAWIKQEMGKGKATKAFVSGIGRDGWTSTGGWKFNSDAYLSYLPNPLDPPGTSATNDPNTLTNAQLKTAPFFNPFRTFDGQSVHGENGSAIAGDYNNRSFLLGHDIPALSNPAGSKEVNLGGNLRDKNTDMMDEMKSGSWGNWQHSDLKEQKMDHVWKLYEDMVSKGKLN